MAPESWNSATGRDGVAKQCVGKQVPAATNTHSKKLLRGTHRDNKVISEAPF